jgi:hypothetical protein
MTTSWNDYDWVSMLDFGLFHLRCEHVEDGWKARIRGNADLTLKGRYATLEQAKQAAMNAALSELRKAQAVIEAADMAALPLFNVAVGD